MTQKETCKRTYDDGSPLSDDHWYYTTYFSCGKSMTEISTYRRPYLKTTVHIVENQLKNNSKRKEIT